MAKRNRQLYQPLPEASLQAQAHQARRTAHASELSEDYVEVIADLIQQHGEARATDIAARLGVSHVTVSRKVAQLARDGLVSTQPYRAIFLTPEGEQIAETSRERHQLVVDFLRALGVQEETALFDAEGIEHHVSDETLAAFRLFLQSRGEAS